MSTPELASLLLVTKSGRRKEPIHRGRGFQSERKLLGRCSAVPRMARPRPGVIAGLVTALAIAVVTGSSASASRPRLHYLLADCTHLRYRPASVVLSCRYQPFTVTNVNWTSWNGPTARGSGIAHVRRCTSSWCPPRHGSFRVNLIALFGRICRPGEPVYSGVVVYLPGTRPPTNFSNENQIPSGCGTLQRKS